MWFDEASSYTYATTFGFSETLQRSALNVHPPLHYFLLKLWIVCFGHSLVALRLMSTVFGIATVAAVYLYCRDAYSVRGGDRSLARRIGLLAACLVAVSSPHILWSQHVRMYTLGTFLAVFTSWLLVEALFARKRSAAVWAAYALAATAFLYTHNFALFTVLAHALFLAGLVIVARLFPGDGGWKHGSVGGGFIALALVLTLYSPWIPVLLQQTERVSSHYWMGSLHAWDFVDAWRQLFFLPVESSGIAGLLCLMGTLAVLSTVAGLGELVDWLVLALSVVPVVAALTVSATLTPIIVPRALLFAHVFVLCAVARTICSLRSTALRWISSVAVIGGALAFHCGHVVAEGYYRRPGLAAVMQHVLAHRAGGEMIVVTHPCLYHAAAYYARGQAETRLFSTKRYHSHYGAGPFLLEADLIDAEELNGSNRDRIWVVETTGYPAVEDFTVPGCWQVLKETRIIQPEVEEFQGVVVAAAYERRRENAKTLE